MKTRVGRWGRLIPFAASALASAALAAAPQPALYYNFEERGTGAGGVITNHAPAATLNGILQGALIVWTNGAPGGATPGGGLFFYGLQRGLGGTYIQTQYAPDDLNLRGASYTMTAWTWLQKPTGDAMVFGQPVSGADWLHNGFRDASPHIGHYGSDLTSGTDVTGAWHHIVWQYDNGMQVIYIDGSRNALATGRVPIRLNDPLIVGSTSGDSDGRDYTGILDEVAIYNEVLQPAQIAYLAGGGSPTNLPDVPAKAFFTAPYGTNGTWNLYQVVGIEVGAPGTWYEGYLASQVADPVAGSGLPGHLVTIASRFENEFVRRLQYIVETNTYRQMYGGDAWIGLTDNDVNSVGLVFPGAHESGNATVEPDVNIRRTNGWVWVNGEPYDATTYMNWNGGEPNDSPSEDGALILQSGLWNDLGTGIPDSGDPANYRAYVIEWDLGWPGPVTGATEIVRQVTPVIPATLPGAAPTESSFTGYWIRNSGAIGSLREGVQRLIAATGTILQTSAGLPTINTYDPTGGDANSGLFLASRPHFGDDPGVADANYVVVYKGRFVVKPEDAGPWTFAARSDDGFALRIPGHNWQKVYGLGIIDHADRSVITYEFGTGNADTRGVVNLAAGTYDIEFVVFQGTGGDYHELFAAKGDWANEGDTDTWRLVGHHSLGVQPIAGIVDPGTGKGWTVTWNDPGSYGALTDTNLAWQAVWPYIGGVNVANVASINFFDPDNAPNEQEIGGSVAFPLDVAGFDEDNFALWIEGQLQVPSNGTYAIGFRGDDGSWLQVEGRTWDSIVWNQTGQSVINGDQLVCNFNTGNSRTVGLITLEAGTYTIRSLFWEQAGGASYDIFTSAGTFSTSALPASFVNRILSTGGTGAVADTAATLTLEEPPPAVFHITDGKLGAAGSTVSVTWESVPGASYRVEVSTNHLVLNEWIPVQGGIPSGGTTTTLNFVNPWSLPFAFLRVVRE